MPVYEPQEDSELLKKFVEKFATGRVLDMGTGSGIQAFAAAQKNDVSSVLAVDIDKDALDHVRSELLRRKKEAPDSPCFKKITVVKSNLFAQIDPDEKFDTILCNPPYLPDEAEDSHPALYGGADGYELILAFLDQAKSRLAPSGSILLLFSSLSNKERILQEFKKLGYASTELAVEVHFFEQLYVYRLWRRGRD